MSQGGRMRARIAAAALLAGASFFGLVYLAAPSLIKDIIYPF